MVRHAVAGLVPLLVSLPEGEMWKVVAPSSVAKPMAVNKRA
jgi:hypothetical protein